MTKQSQYRDRLLREKPATTKGGLKYKVTNNGFNVVTLKNGVESGHYVASDYPNLFGWNRAPKPVKVDSLSLNEEIVLACAFRYALGRMTYVVDSVASEIERQAHRLPRKDLIRYANEIVIAIKDKHAGMDMDVKRWSQLRNNLLAELGRRNED